jgi:5-enolpyruvylshikimate-3-phosphate synthase
MSLFNSAKANKVQAAKRVVGSVRMPGDKSISHRYAMLAAIAEGPSEIHGFSASADCRSTLECLKQLGVKIECQEHTVVVQGAGLSGLRDHDADAGRHPRWPAILLCAHRRCVALAPADEACD